MGNMSNVIKIMKQKKLEKLIETVAERSINEYVNLDVGFDEILPMEIEIVTPDGDYEVDDITYNKDTKQLCAFTVCIDVDLKLDVDENLNRLDDELIKQGFDFIVTDDLDENDNKEDELRRRIVENTINLKPKVFRYLDSQDPEDWWDNDNFYYNSTLAAEEVIIELNIMERDEDDVFEFVSDWFEANNLETM